MNLTGSRRAELHRALLSAFPTPADLEQMVLFGLGENLNAIAGTGSTRDLVFKLMQWAEARGRLEELLKAAVEANPGNAELAAFAAECGPGAAGGATPVVAEEQTPPPTSPTPATPPAPAELFYSYAHEDEELRNELAKHLRQMQREGLIQPWHDREITAGSEWANSIDEHLNSAQVILLLVSADFLDSDYSYDIELKRALERHAAGEARVIPIILRPCDWQSAPFGRLQALPKDVKPVTLWPNRDEAFLNVAQGIRAAIRQMNARPS